MRYNPPLPLNLQQWGQKDKSSKRSDQGFLYWWMNETVSLITIPLK